MCKLCEKYMRLPCAHAASCAGRRSTRAPLHLGAEDGRKAAGASGPILHCWTLRAPTASNPSRTCPTAKLGIKQRGAGQHPKAVGVEAAPESGVGWGPKAVKWTAHDGGGGGVSGAGGDCGIISPLFRACGSLSSGGLVDGVLDGGTRLLLQHVVVADPVADHARRVEVPRRERAQRVECVRAHGGQRVAGGGREQVADGGGEAGVLGVHEGVVEAEGDEQTRGARLRVGVFGVGGGGDNVEGVGVADRGDEGGGRVAGGGAQRGRGGEVSDLEHLREDASLDEGRQLGAKRLGECGERGEQREDHLRLG
mmetsp:Transcript_24036/g.64460  ORF Transcript_24036/g.64460 Transcript_24036/m.64460 type:complete len:310 (+) Transcript_24036:241-1170(+)